VGKKIISPGGHVTGVVELPGDKSISHRYAILAALAKGRSEILNYATAADCQSTLECLRCAKFRQYDAPASRCSGRAAIRFNHHGRFFVKKAADAPRCRAAAGDGR
jgi:5-enolpyruvylshikimate-3-phosphate synthase